MLVQVREFWNRQFQQNGHDLNKNGFSIEPGGFSTELRGFSTCRTSEISTGLGDFQQIFRGFSLSAGAAKLLSTEHYRLSEMM